MDIILEKNTNHDDLLTGICSLIKDTAEEPASHLPVSSFIETHGHVLENLRSNETILDVADELPDPEQDIVTLPDEDSSNTIYIEFAEGDGRDPNQFSKTTKWVITAVGCVFSVLGAMNVSSYALGFPSMIVDLKCTRFQAAIGLGSYGLGIGLVPLVSSSFSEEFGRRPLYVASAIGFSLMHLMSALAKNVQTIIIARFLSGGFASTSTILVGGTIADIWGSEERGLPMSIFSLMVVGPPGIGAFMAGWIEQNPHLGWRWIQWVSLILSGFLVVSTTIFMKETRPTVLLIKLARKMRKETGDQRYRARAEDELPSLRKLIWITATRPLHLLLTEPVLASFSLWVGFIWGLLYAIVESIEPMFSTLHKFNSAEVGSVFMTIVVGSVLGYFTNVFQEKAYQRIVTIRGPEARLAVVCFITWLAPMGMFIYAWTAFPFVHWIAPVIGVVLFMWSLYSIFWTGFIYLADVYGPYASSAVAGLSLSRNIMATILPLVTQLMFDSLGYNWSITIFALLALIMAPIPAVEYYYAPVLFILFFYGPKIRARSKFASKVVHQN